MKSIRQKVLSGEWMGGTFLNLGSSFTAEIAGKAGFDWILIDIEHGMGDRQEALYQLQALEGTPPAPVVRIAWNDPVRFKRVLDLGPSGVMIPYISSVEEAHRAVSGMRYPPAGIRGVASMTRASNFGTGFHEYFATANAELLTVVQIETKEAVEHADEIAAVDGADVLFVGPTDLSVSLGVVRQFNHPLVQTAFVRVVDACRRSRKAAGILVSNEEELAQVRALGFTFVAIGSDGAVVVRGMKELAAALSRVRARS